MKSRIVFVDEKLQKAFDKLKTSKTEGLEGGDCFIP